METIKKEKEINNNNNLPQELDYKKVVSELENIIKQLKEAKELISDFRAKENKTDNDYKNFCELAENKIVEIEKILLQQNIEAKQNFIKIYSQNVEIANKEKIIKIASFETRLKELRHEAIKLKQSRIVDSVLKKKLTEMLKESEHGIHPMLKAVFITKFENLIDMCKGV